MQCRPVEVWKLIVAILEYLGQGAQQRSEALREALNSEQLQEALNSEAMRESLTSEQLREALRSEQLREALNSEALRESLRSENLREALNSEALLLNRLLVISIASGATILSHVNDSGFWLVNRLIHPKSPTSRRLFPCSHSCGASPWP